MVGPVVWFGVYDAPTDRDAVGSAVSVGPWSASMSTQEHADAVASILRSIEAGDTYQANLTFAMTADFGGDADGLFHRMVDAQSRSYAALLDLGDTQVISVSPELFLEASGRTVTTRPMKGTAPRGRSSEEDEMRRNELRTSEKEQAGNIMIVDLLRNDLGRVSEAGSIVVPSLFEPERHPTVWQLTSTVQGELTDDVGLFELFAATFPSGSVTGAPKVSTMDIIAGIETVPRGVYCGAIGYIEPGADRFEFSVAIRTGIVHEGEVTYHVGGGITYDSMAGAEYDECLWKALVVTSENRVPVLLETMLYQPDQGIRLLEGHLHRLSRSAQYWDIPLDLESVGDALSSVGGHRPQKVRLMVAPGGEVEVEIHDVEDLVEPVQLQLSEVAVDPSDPMWFHKTADRSRYPSADEEGMEILMMNLDRELTETNISNLLLRFGEVWVTPPVASGCLPGVYRQSLIDSGTVVERRVTLDDLMEADEIAVTNAVRGYRKAVLIG
jgi:para-aminobenzoate synthetase/4-amino-4-deoxychorismate lyase